MLTKEIRTATCSKRVYPSTEVVNTLLVGAAAKVMGVSEEVAVEKLQDKMMLPVRKPAKGMALVVSYQYIKRVFGHFNGSLSSIAVSTFVKRTHALKNIGSWRTPSASSTRRILEQSPEECMELLQADSFFKDAHGRLAMLDVLANVVEELEATASMVSWVGPNNAIRVIRCLYGHVANVSFRVRYWGFFCFPLQVRLCCNFWVAHAALPIPASVYSLLNILLTTCPAVGVRTCSIAMVSAADDPFWGGSHSIADRYVRICATAPGCRPSWVAQAL